MQSAPNRGEQSEIGSQWERDVVGVQTADHTFGAGRIGANRGRDKMSHCRRNWRKGTTSFAEEFVRMLVSRSSV